ncbi:hypothetical protein, partial [Azospirillum sp. TSH20]|uniref:hypothetical protein n=1 Tax=Azospirillum sp. TSH20 TaxID=652754 RepID=UPI001B3B7C6A
WWRAYESGGIPRGYRHDRQATIVDVTMPPADQTRLWPVHRDVGNVRNDRPELIAPINPA